MLYTAGSHYIMLFISRKESEFSSSGSDDETVLLLLLCAMIATNLTLNQLMVQQLMSEGNMRSRLRKASPMGLKASRTCRLRRIRSMNLLYMLRGVTSTWRFSAWAITCIWQWQGTVSSTGHRWG